MNANTVSDPPDGMYHILCPKLSTTYIFCAESTATAYGRRIEASTTIVLTEGVPIYELVALKNSDPLALPSAEQIKFCDEFTKGFRFYLEQRWDEAINIFNTLQVAFGKDEPCEMYIQRCEEFKKSPPPVDWDGVYHLKTK